MSVLDYKLQHDLRRYIGALPIEQQEQLKSVRLCNRSINGNRQAVYVLASGDNARLYGTNTCKNPFCCPVCSAKVMEKYRARIASAIACLKRDYFGVMVSFSIAHQAFMGCREQMDILYDTWKYFRLKSFKRQHGHAFHDFNKVHPVAHHVKVCEHTHGKNGWHAHFHCIFWFKRGDERTILSEGWDDKLNAFWERVGKLKTVQYWRKHKLHEKIFNAGYTYESLVDKMWSPDDRAVCFSKDEDGNLLEVEDAEYISGWGTDKELTGNRRKQASHKGHRTPYQILDDAQHDEKSRKLYMEFCLAMTKKPVHHRVDFSQTGLNDMIKAWQAEHGYSSSINQKKSEDGERHEWKVVAYFDKKQWCGLLCLEREFPVISNILFLAARYRCLLGDYLLSLGGMEQIAPRELEDVEAIFDKSKAKTKETTWKPTPESERSISLVSVA